MAVVVGWMAGTAIRDMNGVIAAAALGRDISAALPVVVAACDIEDVIAATAI